jgi:hypothetical protein
MVLSVAMVATSGNFTLDAYAMENATDLSVDIAEDMESVSENDISENDVSDNSETEMSDDLDAEVSDGDVSKGDVSEGDTSEGDVEDVSDDDVSAGDTGDVKVNTGDAQIYATTTDCFTVTEDGTLTWKVDVTTDKISGTVKLPAEAKKIPAGIFNQNTKITGIEVPEDSQLTEIAAGAFEGSGVTSFAMPDAVTRIEDETFKDSKLQTLTFSSAGTSQLTYIGEEAFAGSALGGSNNKGLDIPSGVTKIGNAAFRGCTNLGSINLKNVEQIGANAFKGCSKLSTITWSAKLTEVGTAAFSGTAVTEVNLNKDDYAKLTTVWGESAFEQCTKLKTVRMNKNVAEISGSMFKGCTALTTFVFPSDSACTVIDAEAFSGCTALQSITIPAKVSKIESEAFGGCTKLQTVTINQKGANEDNESDIVLADDAFPYKSDLTMKGYDGTVEDYANKMEYTFVTLYPAHTITLDITNASNAHGKAELSTTSARKGETVKVTITPEDGYRIRAYDFMYNEYNIDTLVEETDSSQVFSFEMPDADVTVYAAFESNSSYGTMKANFENQTYYEWNSTGKKLTIDKPGRSANLEITSSKGYTIGNWEFTYKSGDTKVAMIDSQGVIYARKKGTAKITATLKSDTSKTVSFTVVVNEESSIDHYELGFSGLRKGKLTTEKIWDSEDKEYKDYTVIQYTKGNLAKESKDFNVSLKATAGQDTANLFVESAWKSANTDIAEPDAATVYDNENVIHVKSGAVGETAVTVTVTNGETGKKKEVLYEESFIIRVVDTAPRLVQSSLTVNSLSSTGTAFDLLSVYGYEVVPSSLSVVKAVKSNNYTSYEDFDYVSIAYDEIAGEYTMKITAAGKTALESKGSNLSYSSLYIEGEYSYSTGTGTATETFHTAIKSLVLSSKALNPTIKLSGKINLFYNSKADASERGEVTVTQSLSSEKVEKYELVSAANYQTSGSEAVDSLANNFDISADGVITRSANALITDAKGKAVTSGYLKITYAGYTEPSYVKISISTQNTKPSYVLSKTKATVNSSSKGYELELQLLEKKTKKAISLDSLAELSFDASAKGTTMDLFENLDVENAKLTDSITLQIKNAQKGKAVINVEMDTWNEPLKFTFNLNVTSSAPTVKAKSATLTLNNLCVGRATTTTLTVSQEDVTLVAIEEKFKGKTSLQDEADKISFDYADGVLSVQADETVKAGTYKFSLVPTVKYTEGGTEEVKAFAVSVKVIDSKLSAVLKPASVTVNNYYAGRETATTTYTIKNMPAGENVTIQDDEVTIKGANAASSAVYGSLDFKFGESSQTIVVSQTSKISKTGTYKFTVSGLKAVVGEKAVDIQPFNISVKVISKPAKLTVKASGTLNPVDENTSIVYSFKTTNVSAAITNVVVKELDTSNNKNNFYDELAHFQIGELVRDADGNITGVSIKAKEGVTLDAKTSYKLRIGIVLTGAESEDDVAAYTGDLTIKPKQVLPKIKADVTSTTMYAGVAAGSEQRMQEIQITKTSNDNAVIEDVVIASSNSDNLQKAFAVTYDSVTQKAKITLVRPDLLKANTEYTVKLEVKAAGQMENTTGTLFNIKIKIMR